jgi:hypothetical protein
MFLLLRGISTEAINEKEEHFCTYTRQMANCCSIVNLNFFIVLLLKKRLYGLRLNYAEQEWMDREYFMGLF